MNGAIIPPNRTLKKVSTLDEAIANATEYIYIFVKGTYNYARICNGLLIPVATLTTEGYYYADYNAWGQLQAFVKKNGYTAISCSWESDATGVVWEYYCS